MGEVKGDMDGLGLFQKPPVREFLEVVRLAVKDHLSLVKIIDCHRGGQNDFFCHNKLVTCHHYSIYIAE